MSDKPLQKELGEIMESFFAFDFEGCIKEMKEEVEKEDIPEYLKDTIEKSIALTERMKEMQNELVKDGMSLLGEALTNISGNMEHFMKNFKKKKSEESK